MAEAIATGNGQLLAPFPYFGGKSTVAAEVWRRFGAVGNYVEPFFGSGAVLLGRPGWKPGMIETVNDLDGMVSNFWRAVKADPQTVAHYMDYPKIAQDLHARHAWLVAQRDSLTDALQANPDFFDAKIAGWWAWGQSAWIGSGWCDGALSKQRPAITGNDGAFSKKVRKNVAGYVLSLSVRLRDVQVCCGDWSAMFAAPKRRATRAVFLDPPYSESSKRAKGLYTMDSMAVAVDVRNWAIENGNDPQFRIALCGYKDEHDMPGWDASTWRAKGGYGNQGNSTGRENRGKEVIWFSPHCLKAKQSALFDD